MQFMFNEPRDYLIGRMGRGGGGGGGGVRRHLDECDKGKVSGSLPFLKKVEGIIELCIVPRGYRGQVGGVFKTYRSTEHKREIVHMYVHLPPSLQVASPTSISTIYCSWSNVGGKPESQDDGKKY